MCSRASNLPEVSSPNKNAPAPQVLAVQPGAAEGRRSWRGGSDATVWADGEAPMHMVPPTGQPRFRVTSGAR
jgi:hypothetical protein